MESGGWQRLLMPTALLGNVVIITSPSRFLFLFSHIRYVSLFVSAQESGLYLI